MIQLFPKFKNRMLLICACYLVLVGVYVVLNPGVHPLVPLLIAVVGVLVVMVSQSLNAANAHAQMLARLYNHLDVSGFLKAYTPFMNLNLKNQSLMLMVRLHISNAYCAQGRFDEAEELLRSISLTPSKKHEDDLLSKFAIVSNLCYCAEQKNDVEKAQAYMDELLSIRKELEALQTGKPDKKKMVFNTELNEQCLKFLKTGKADLKLLQGLVQNNTQQLHRITISLWVARAYLAENNRREAEKLLEQIVKLAPDLYPGKVAAQLLSGLPAKTEEKH